MAAEPCVCGHDKRDHVYEETVCRPDGVVCLCERFRADPCAEPDEAAALELVELHRLAERSAREALNSARRRNRAVCDLYNGQTWTHQRIADLLGVTVGRVGQIVRAGTRQDGEQ